MFRRVTRVLELDPVEAPVRLNLVASQVAGVIMTRYIIRIEPMASLAPETIVALVGPTVQRYLDAPLPSVPGRA